MMRLVHLVVIGALVFAAAYVYRIKMDSTARTEKVLRLHAEIREERDAIARLRAEWARLDATGRLQGLAERHLKLKPVGARQFDRARRITWIAVGLSACVMATVGVLAVGAPDVWMRLFTDETARGQGVARALIDAVAAEARRRGASRYYWQTRQDNARARALYDRRGWSPWECAY